MEKKNKFHSCSAVEISSINEARTHEDIQCRNGASKNTVIFKYLSTLRGAC